MTALDQQAFAELYGRGAPFVLSRRLINDLETPVSAYLKLGAGHPYAFLFESVEGGSFRGRYSILTLAPDLVWRAWGDICEIARGDGVASGAFERQPAATLETLRQLEAACRIGLPADLPPMAAGLFGVFGYDLVRLVEPLGAPNPDPLGLPDAILVRPSIIAIFDSLKQEILLSAPIWPDARSAEAVFAIASGQLDRIEAALNVPLPARKPAPPARATALVSTTGREAYCAAVEKAKAYIADGDIFQVVPSHRLTAKDAPPPFAFYRALRRLNPSPFLFFLEFGDFQITGSSPEILVRLRDGQVTIRPLAGTRPRGADPITDKALEQELLADPKERAEHLMLLDLGRNDVGRVAKPATVKVTESFVVERYSHVMHIVSNVVGDVDPDLSPVDVLLAALPAGTLSGAPKVRAMEIIDELETVKRGVAYAGGVGYISSSGAVDVCIVLRTALFKDGSLHVQAGAGVVSDSDPNAEYNETLQKAQALARAAEEAWTFSD